MNVVITGASGHLGRLVADRVLQHTESDRAILVAWDPSGSPEPVAQACASSASAPGAGTRPS